MTLSHCKDVLPYQPVVMSKILPLDLLLWAKTGRGGSVWLPKLLTGNLPTLKSEKLATNTFTLALFPTSTPSLVMSVAHFLRNLPEILMYVYTSYIYAAISSFLHQM